MKELVLRETCREWRIWSGLFVANLVMSVVGGICASLAETKSRLDGPGSAVFTPYPMLVVNVIASVVVIGILSTMAVAAQHQTFALWQLAGIAPRRVGAVVLGQAALVSALASALGSLLVVPLVAGDFFQFMASTSGNQDARELARTVNASYGLNSAVGVLIFCVGIAVLAASHAARRASRQRILAYVAPRQSRDRRLLTIVRAACAVIALVLVGLLTIACAFGTDTNYATLYPSGVPGSVDTSFWSSLAEPSQAAFLLAFAMPMAVVLTLGFALPWVIRGWTAIVPSRMSSTWFLARHSAMARLSITSAMVTPLTVGMSLVCCVTTYMRVTEPYDPPVVQLAIFFGAPLLTATVGLSCAIVMSARGREGEIALLQTAGVTRAAIVWAALLEALIYVTTSMLISVISGLIVGIAATAQRPSAQNLPIPVSLSEVAVVAGIGLVVMVASIEIPIIAFTRLSVAEAMRRV